MGKYIANTATSYRFIACLGAFGLIAALAIGQTTIVGPSAHVTLRGPNVFTTQSINPNPALNQTLFNSTTSQLGSSFPTMPAQPIQNGFTNPFTGVTQPA